MSGKKWSVSASIIARNTFNPIRAVVENLRIEPLTDKPLISLSLGDPTVFGNFGPPEKTIEAVQESLESQRYNGYAPSRGYEEARQAVAEYASICGLKFDAQDVILCSGCSGAMDLCISVLASPGQNILVPCPGFSIYRTLAQGLGINVKTYRLLPEKGWEIDMEDLHNQVDTNTVAIVLINPSNPCSCVYTADHLRDLLHLAKQHRLPIITDEIYERMVFPGHTFHPLASLSSDIPVLSCSGLTKRFLVPGWRMGWITIHDPKKIFGNEIRDGLNRLSTRILGSNTLIQGALPKLLRDTPESFFSQTLETLQKHSKLAFSMLSEAPGLKPTMPQGAFYMMVRIDMSQFPRISCSKEFVEKLVSEESVFCLPGECFNYPGYMRLVMTVPEDQIKEACQRISLFCRRHHAQVNQSLLVSQLQTLNINECVDKKTPVGVSTSLYKIYE